MFKKAMIIKSDDNIEYIIMSVIIQDGNEYALANKFIKEKPTYEYIVFKTNDGKIIMEDDSTIINKLLPLFQKNIDNDLNRIIN